MVLATNNQSHAPKLAVLQGDKTLVLKYVDYSFPETTWVDSLEFEERGEIVKTTLGNNLSKTQVEGIVEGFSENFFNKAMEIWEETATARKEELTKGLSEIWQTFFQGLEIVETSVTHDNDSFRPILNVTWKDRKHAPVMLSVYREDTDEKAVLWDMVDKPVQVKEKHGITIEEAQDMESLLKMFYGKFDQKMKNFCQEEYLKKEKQLLETLKQ